MYNANVKKPSIKKMKTYMSTVSYIFLFIFLFVVYISLIAVLFGGYFAGKAVALFPAEFIEVLIVAWLISWVKKTERIKPKMFWVGFITVILMNNAPVFLYGYGASEPLLTMLNALFATLFFVFRYKRMHKLPEKLQTP